MAVTLASGGWSVLRQPASRYRATDACTDWRDTPTSAATSVTAAPSSTVLYRCSTTDNATNANPGLRL